MIDNIFLSDEEYALRIRFIDELASEHGFSDVAVAIMEFQALIDWQLGMKFPLRKRIQLEKNIGELRLEQCKLQKSLASKKLSKKDFLHQQQILFERIMDKCKDILSEDEYKKLFELGKDMPFPNLVDEQVFLKE